MVLFCQVSCWFVTNNSAGINPSSLLLITRWTADQKSHLSERCLPLSAPKDINDYLVLHEKQTMSQLHFQFIFLICLFLISIVKSRIKDL